jgi:hypothetical protein
MTTAKIDPTKKPLFSSTTYDTLLNSTLYALPVLGAFYFAIAQIWGLPAAEQVLGTILALETAIGGLIAASKKRYKETKEAYDGGLVIDETGEIPNWSFEADLPLDELAKLDTVRLKVLKVDESNSQ